MPKALCIFGMAVAALMLLIFLLDLAVGMPFHSANPWTLDLPMILCALGLGYLSWVTFREQV
jgi:hypothetical protein